MPLLALGSTLPRKIHRGLQVREVDEPTYHVDPAKLERYDQANLIFNRIGNDPHWQGYQRTEEEAGLQNIQENKPGYNRVDYALTEATWTIYEVWKDAFNWTRLERPQGPSLLGEKWYQTKHPVKDPQEMTRKLKRTAQFIGADLVGIAEINTKWVYKTERYTLSPLELPEEVKYAVVMAVEMDELGIATSPETPAAAATGLGYSKMAFISSILAEFIRNLGYTAIPSGNEIAFSIPIAVDAGLGQLGRNGLLITPEYGPRVRLCKVFTDLPLVPDKPIDFGVNEFCSICKKCAYACSVQAISHGEQTYEGVCKSSSPGVLKWPVDGEKCYNFWCDNGTDCSDCINVCPYNTGRTQATTKEFWK